MQEALKSLLSGPQVDIVPIGTVQEALQTLTSTSFDCMVTDLSLPDASGFDLLDHMAEDPNHSFPPVIVYTGRALNREEELRLRRHSRSIIVKGARSPERLQDEVTLRMSHLPSLHPTMNFTEPSMTDDQMLKILVVDDVPQNLLATQAMLSGEDCQLLMAESGPAALELLLQHEVALALLDVQMPGMDGFALAELMRGTERTSHVPIIFLTAASAEPAWSFRGYEAGAVDFLYKPLDARVLQSKVRVFLDLARQQRALERHSAELERLSRANALMLGALSHDIRTPRAAPPNPAAHSTALR